MKKKSGLVDSTVSVWQYIWGQINVCLPYPAPFEPEPLGKIVEQESNNRFQGAKWGPVNRSVEPSRLGWGPVLNRAGCPGLRYPPVFSSPVPHL